MYHNATEANSQEQWQVSDWSVTESSEGANEGPAEQTEQMHTYLKTTVANCGGVAVELNAQGKSTIDGSTHCKLFPVCKASYLNRLCTLPCLMPLIRLDFAVSWSEM